jgi:hypothetical protein
MLAQSLPRGIAPESSFGSSFQTALSSLTMTAPSTVSCQRLNPDASFCLLRLMRLRLFDPRDRLACLYVHQGEVGQPRYSPPPRAGHEHIAHHTSHQLFFHDWRLGFSVSQSVAVQDRLRLPLMTARAGIDMSVNRLDHFSYSEHAQSLKQRISPSTARRIIECAIFESACFCTTSRAA